MGQGSQIMIWTHGRVFYKVNVCRWYSFSTFCIIFSVHIYCLYHININSKSIFIISKYILIRQNLVDCKLYAPFASCVFVRDSFINLLLWSIQPETNEKEVWNSWNLFFNCINSNICWLTRIFSLQQMKVFICIVYVHTAYIFHHIWFTCISMLEYLNYICSVESEILTCGCFIGTLWTSKSHDLYQR